MTVVGTSASDAAGNGAWVSLPSGAPGSTPAFAAAGVYAGARNICYLIRIICLNLMYRYNSLIKRYRTRWKE